MCVGAVSTLHAVLDGVHLFTPGHYRRTVKAENNTGGDIFQTQCRRPSSAFGAYCTTAAFLHGVIGKAVAGGPHLCLSTELPLQFATSSKTSVDVSTTTSAPNDVDEKCELL